jgi:hypothetical protein
MNQKSLAYVPIYGPPIAATTDDGRTTGDAVDIGVGYANVGRREMKIVGSLVPTELAGTFSVLIQHATTSGGNDGETIATIAMTTSGSFTTHVATTRRYLRVVWVPSGTDKFVGHVAALVEKRAS